MPTSDNGEFRQPLVSTHACTRARARRAYAVSINRPRKKLYHLFAALRIHISETCKKLLDRAGGFHIEERGMTMIKGKGEMRTYWLQGKADQSALKMPHTLSPCPAQAQYTKFSAQFLQPVALSPGLRSNSLTGSWSPSSTAFRCQGRTCSTGGGRLPFFRGLD